MPARMIRDDLLESDRWLGLRDNASRCAFFALILRADDLGNIEGSPVRLMRLWRDFGINTPEKVARTLVEMVEVDLVRTYKVGDKEYVHIPRFGQRIRHLRRANPESPWNTNSESKQGPEEKTPDERPTDDGRTPDERPTNDGLREVKGSEVKGSEEKRREEKPPSSDKSDGEDFVSNGNLKANGAKANPPTEFAAMWADYPARLGDNPKVRAFRAWSARLAEGESVEVMHAGVLRYAAYLKKIGKLGTEYVKHASVFFGPNRGYLDPWNSDRDVATKPERVLKTSV